MNTPPPGYNPSDSMLSGGTTPIVGVQGGGAQQKTKRAKRSFSTTRKVQNVAKRDLEGGNDTPAVTHIRLTVNKTIGGVGTDYAMASFSIVNGTSTIWPWPANTVVYPVTVGTTDRIPLTTAQANDGGPQNLLNERNNIGKYFPWFPRGTGSQNPAAVIFALGVPTRFNAYKFGVADARDRTPNRWKLEYSIDGINFITFDDRSNSDQTIPPNPGDYTQIFPVTFPLPPAIVMAPTGATGAPTGAATATGAATGAPTATATGAATGAPTATATPAATGAAAPPGCAINPVATTIGSSDAIAATTFSTPIVTTYAGKGTAGHLPNIYRPASLTPVRTTPQQQFSVPITAAAFNTPKNICIDSSGNIYVSDTANSVIKRISNGITTLFAGADAENKANGTFSSPRGLVMDFAGRNLYIADASSIKKINIASKSVTTFCGNANSPGFTDGNANSAKFNTPTYLDIDSTGNLYVVDSRNSKVRIINTSGIASTPSWNTNFPCPPICVRCSSNGTLYVALMNGSIYKVSPAGSVSVFSGSGRLGFSDGPSSSSSYNVVSGMILDSANNLYLADTGNNRIRKVESTGRSSTIIGDGSAGIKNTDASTGPLQVSLKSPNDIAMDRSGNLYIVDTGNHVIRHVAIAPPKADQLLNEITNIHKSIQTDVQLLTDSSANPSSIQQGIKNIITGFLRIHSLNIQAMNLYPSLQETLASSVANLQPNMAALSTSGPSVGGALLQMGGDSLFYDSSLIKMSADQLQKKKFESPLKDGDVPSVVIGARIEQQRQFNQKIEKDQTTTQAGIKIPKFGFYDKWGPADPSKLHANVDTVMVPLLNNLYAIRKPSVGARENWKRLLFTQEEANFLNDSKVTPGILQEVFAKRYELTINLVDINSANPTVNSLIQIGPAPEYKIEYPKEKITDTRGKLFLFLEKNITNYFDAKDPLEPGVRARVHDTDPPIIEVRNPLITGKPTRITMQLDFPQAFMQKDDIKGLVYALEGRLKIKPITIIENASFNPGLDPSKVSWPVRLADALTKIADGSCRVDYKIAWLNKCSGVKDFIKQIADFHMKNDDRMRMDTLLTINSMKMLKREGVTTAMSTDPYKYTGIAKLIKATELETFTEGGVAEIDFAVKFNYTSDQYSRNVALHEMDGSAVNFTIARLVIPANGLNFKDATELLKKEYAQLLNQNPRWNFYPAT